MNHHLFSTLLLALFGQALGHGKINCPLPRQYRDECSPALGGWASNSEPSGYKCWTYWMGITIPGTGAYAPSEMNANNLNSGIGGASTFGWKDGDYGICGDIGNSPGNAFQNRNGFSLGEYGAQKAKAVYKAGETMNVKILISAYHAGWLEFRLGVPDDDTNLKGANAMTQQLLNQHVLKISPTTKDYAAVTDYQGMTGYGDGSPGGGAIKCKDSGGHIDPLSTTPNTHWPFGSCCNTGGTCSAPADNNDRYVLEKSSKCLNGDCKDKGLTEFEIELELPEGIECEHCVLQWLYQTGNSPGVYPEAFKNCADVAIKNDKYNGETGCHVGPAPLLTLQGSWGPPPPAPAKPCGGGWVVGGSCQGDWGVVNASCKCNKRPTLTTAAPTTAPASDKVNPNCVAAWSQCDGGGDGRTTCCSTAAAPYSCVAQSEWYSNCQPGDEEKAKSEEEELKEKFANEMCGECKCSKCVPKEQFKDVPTYGPYCASPANGCEGMGCSCCESMNESGGCESMSDKPAPKCCKAITASCMACANGLTETEYCARSPNTDGCPTTTRPPTAPATRAPTAPAPTSRPAPAPKLGGYTKALAGFASAKKLKKLCWDSKGKKLQKKASKQWSGSRSQAEAKCSAKAGCVGVHQAGGMGGEASGWRFCKSLPAEKNGKSLVAYQLTAASDKMCKAMLPSPAAATPTPSPVVERTPTPTPAPTPTPTPAPTPTPKEEEEKEAEEEEEAEKKAEKEAEKEAAAPTAAPARSPSNGNSNTGHSEALQLALDECGGALKSSAFQAKAKLHAPKSGGGSGSCPDNGYCENFYTMDSLLEAIDLHNSGKDLTDQFPTAPKGAGMGRCTTLASFLGETYYESAKYTACKEHTSPCTAKFANACSGGKIEDYQPSKQGNWDPKTLPSTGKSHPTTCTDFWGKTPTNLDDCWFGRGAIQLTWLPNYVRYLPEYADDPDRICTDGKIGWLGSVGYWRINAEAKGFDGSCASSTGIPNPASCGSDCKKSRCDQYTALLAILKPDEAAPATGGGGGGGGSTCEVGMPYANTPTPGVCSCGASWGEANNNGIRCSAPSAPPANAFTPVVTTTANSKTQRFIFTGSEVNLADRFVFLAAGDPSCAGAAAKKNSQGGQINGVVLVGLVLTDRNSFLPVGDYKMCKCAYPGTGTLDTDWVYIEGQQLTVNA